jgi:hypothetical protein
VYWAADITEQGVLAKFGHNREQYPDKMVDMMRSYLAKKGPVEIGIRGTCTAI